VNFSVLITFFATPVTIMLFPAFSKLDYRKDNETLRNVFQYSVKYASLIVVPLFLALLSITYLYTAFGNLSIANLINGQGYTTFNMKLSILTVAIGFPVSFLLISNFGVIGLIAT